MSLPSPISVDEETLSPALAIDNLKDVRFIVTAVNLTKEIVELADTVKLGKSLENDLPKLSASLSDTSPRHIFVRLDDDAGWVFVSYVPKDVGFRERFPHATSQIALKNVFVSRGNTLNNGRPLEVTSRDELTSQALIKHNDRESFDPKLLSQREIELESAKESERAAYEGAQRRVLDITKTHVEDGLKWSPKASAAAQKLTVGSGQLLIVTIEKSADKVISVKLLDESSPAPIKSSLSDLRSKIDAALKKSAKPVIALYAREEPTGNLKLISIRIGLPDDLELRFQYPWHLLPSVEKTVLSALNIRDDEKRRWELDSSDGLEEKVTSLLEDDASADTGTGAGGSASSGAGAGSGAGGDEKKTFSRPKPPARRK